MSHFQQAFETSLRNSGIP